MRATGEKSNEAVLALPLGRLLAKIVRIDSADKEGSVAAALAELKAASPYPDDDLTLSLETMRETASGQIAIAAALPESATEDIGEALDAAKLNITRIDALSLGVLREKWPFILGNQPEADASVRRLVFVQELDDVAAFAMDGDMPVAMRAISGLSIEADMVRETTRLLLEAEDFGGSREVAEVVTLGDVPVEGLGIFSKNIRRLELAVEDHAGFDGVAERSVEEGTLNALPESWRVMLEETRFKGKMKRALVAAISVWVLVMAVLFGVPVAYGYMTDHQKSLSRAHSRRYNEVKEMREKVRLVQKYSDHSRGALEILKAVSDRMPAGIVLGNWNFKREDGVRFSGESDDASSVYVFKDALQAMAFGEDDDAEKVFAQVLLTGPSATKGGKQKFDIECRYESEEER